MEANGCGRAVCIFPSFGHQSVREQCLRHTAIHLPIAFILVLNPTHIEWQITIPVTATLYSRHARELRTQGAICHPTRDGNNSCHSQFHRVCLQVLEVLRHIITHIHLVAYYHIQTTSSIVRKQHLVVLQRVSFLFLHGSNKGIRNIGSRRSDRIGKIRTKGITIGMPCQQSLHNGIFQEQARGGQFESIAPICHLHSRESRFPDLCPLRLFDRNVGKEYIHHIVLHAHCLHQFVAAHKYVHRKHLFVLQTQVASFLSRPNGCTLQAQAGGIFIRHEKRTRRNQSSMRETKRQFFCRTHFLSQSGIHRGLSSFHLCGVHTPHDNRNQASFHRHKSIHQQHSLWSLLPKRGIQHVTRKEGLTTNHHGFSFAQSLIHSLQ